MKKNTLLLITFLVILGSIRTVAQNRYWIAASTSNWNNTANWSASSGGPGGASVPGPAETVNFNGAGPGNCNLDVPPTVNGINVNGYTGTIDLLGNNLTTTGTNTFTTGTISNSGGAASVTLNTTNNSTFNGTLFNANLSGTTGRLFLNGSTFNGTLDLTKTTNTTDTNTGGNTFNSTVSITNSSTSSIQLGNTNPDIFNGTVTFTTNSTGDILPARASTGNQFNGNILLNYNSAAGHILFGSNSGTSTLADGFTISINSFGVSGCANLQLAYFTQLGNTPQSIILAGNSTATLTLGPSSIFNGSIVATTPVLVFNSSTFNNTGDFTQTSTTNTGNSRGGNVFHGAVTMTNTGDGDLILGANGADAGDTFNGAATFNDLGGGRIRVGASTPGNVFNADATFNSSGSTNSANRIQISRFSGASTTFNGTTRITNNGNSSDIHVCYDPGSLATFNGPLILTSNTSASGDFEMGRSGDVVINGNLELNSTCTDNIQLSAGSGSVTFGNGTISIGASGFSQGQLTFLNFIQTGAVPTSLNLTGSRVNLGPNSSFGGNVSIIANRMFLNGATYNGTAYLEKNGATDDAGIGNNIFQSTTEIVNSGSGYLLTGNNGADTFNGDLTLSNTGSNIIYVGHNSPGTVFNGNVVVNSTAGNGIYISNAANGTSSLSATKTISVGGLGFTSGELRLMRFTQIGSTAQALTLTNETTLRVGPTCQFDGDVNFISPQIYLNGCIYNGSAYIEKNGATNNTGSGDNIFNGTTQIVNSGSAVLRTNGNNIFNGVTTITNNAPADILLELTSGSTYNNTVTFTNTGSSNIRVGYLGTNVFNGDIILNCTSGTGITFSENVASTSTLTAGNTVAIGGAGFTSGTLNLNRFTQVGSTSQALTLTNAGILNIGPASQFDGNVNFVAPDVLLNGCTYNGTAYIEKNGANNNNGAGSNIFNSTAEIVNSGSGYILSANTAPDTFNGDLTLSNTGSGTLYMAHNAGTFFNGNIVVNSTNGNGVYFSNGTGTGTLAATKTISVGGLGFNSGELRLIRFTQVGATDQTLTLTNTALLRLGPTSQFDGNINFIAPRVLLNGTTYNGTAYIEKTGALDDAGNGGNVFNAATSLVNSGTDYLLTGNATSDIFNGPLTITNTASDYIYLAHNSAGNQFNNSITLNNSGNGILFSNTTGASSTLATGFTIQVGGSGFTAGELRLRQFTQTGPAAQNLLLTGTSILRIGFASQFDGSVDFRAPRLILDGCTYNGTTYLEKTGATDDSSAGNNIFNSTTTIANSGSGYIRSAVGALDTFNGNLTLTNTGTATIRMGDVIPGTIFNGNVTLNCTNGGGIYFGDISPANATLASGRTITIGGSGFSTGELRFNRFIQLGNTPQNLTLSGDAQMTLGPGGQFNGNVNLVAPRIFLDGTVYNGTAFIQKSGAGNDTGAGNNVFNGATTLVNSGDGYLLTGNTLPDVFNGTLTVTNSGTNIIYLAHASSGNQFNENVQLNTTSGNGIYFSNSSSGNSTLASGKTISIGGLGWNSGDLLLRRFTQNGSTGQTIIIPVSASTSILTIGPNTTFNGNVDFRSPRITLDGATYNGTAHIEKTGATSDNSSGGNVFNQQTTFVNSGSAEFRHGVTSLDTYNGDLILTSSGSSFISMSRNVSGNLYNGNIQLNSTAGSGIRFGDSNGTSVLAATKTISIGAGGFSAGDLYLRYFSQVGGTPQSITLTGTSLLRVGPSSQFDGNVNFIAPQILLQGCTYNGTTYIEKNGATPNDSYGNNIFNGVTTIVNSGTARFRLSNDNTAGNNGDQFNNDVTFSRTGTGTLDPVYHRTNYFRGNVITNDATTGITFGANTGVAEFSGTNAQTISKAAGLSPIFRRLLMNKASNTLSLNTDISVSVDATFTQGVINSTATNYINILNGATTTGMNNTSYVEGPVRKTGNAAYTFPVGSGGFYRPISISAPSNITHHFTAQYFRTAQPFGGNSTWDPGFYTVSGCEYWTLDRTNGTSNVTVTLSWNESACDVGYITNPVDLRVTRWTGAAWADLGNGGTTGTATNGTITTSSAVTAFSPFTLASTTSLNPLPVELAYFRGKVVDGVANLEWRTLSELNNDYFTLERSSTGIDFETLAKIPGHLTSEGVHDYAYYDEAPYRGRSYYRLKQTDLDGTSKYLSIVTIYIESSEVQFFVYPNPASKEPVHLNQKSNITIYNNLQQPVLKAEGIETFDPSSLPAGVYIIYNQKGEMTRLVIY